MPQTSPSDRDLLCENDLVTRAGTIDRSILMRISAQRARREREAYVAIGAARAWPELLGEELRRTWSIARVMHECEHGRRTIANMPAVDRDVRRLELQLERLRHGLATPSDLKTQDDIDRFEALLTQAREAQLNGAISSGIHIGLGRFDRASSRARPRSASESRPVPNRSSSQPSGRRAARAK